MSNIPKMGHLMTHGERLTCHVFTARCKGATPTIQSTADLFLQHVTASVCSMRRVCGISRLQKTLSLVLVLPISLATSIFAPLRHLKPIRGALLQPHLITDLLRAGTSARGPQLRKTHMSCVYSPLQGSYAHNTINYRPFSATRHKAGCKSVKATASRALIKHSVNGASSLEA